MLFQEVGFSKAQERARSAAPVSLPAVPVQPAAAPAEAPAVPARAEAPKDSKLSLAARLREAKK